VPDLSIIAKMNQHRVLVPEDRSPEQRRKSLLRAITALVFARLERASPIKIAERSFPRDPNAAHLVRAISAPADSSGTYPQVTTTSALPLLAPKSAALKLFQSAMQIDLSGKFSVKVPSIAARTTPIFIVEGGPMPVAQYSVAATEVGPCKKILIGTAVSSELQSATPGTASAIIGACLARDAEKSLDAIAFSAGAGDAATPVGLLHGVVPLSASTNTGIVGIGDDLGSLRQAIANSNIDASGVIFVTAPKQATTLSATLFDYPVLESLAVPAGTIIAIAPDAIAVAADTAPPTVEVTTAAVAQFEDADPLQIVDSGGVLAAGTRSLFQHDLIGIKIRCALTWASIAPGAVQMIQNVAW
jgi:hypothetical protein